MDLTIEVKIDAEVYRKMRRFLRELGFNQPNIRSGAFYYNPYEAEAPTWKLIPGLMVAHCYILAVQ